MSKWYHRTTSTVTFTLCYESDQITAFSHFAVNLHISNSMMSAVNNQLQSTHISRQSINIIWCNVMLGLFHIVRFLEFTPVHCSVSLSTESMLSCVLSHTEKFYARDIPHSTCFQWITLDKKNLLGFSIIEICWNIASQVVIFIVTNFCLSPDLTYLHLEISKSLKQSRAICYTNSIFCSVIFHNMNYRQSWKKMLENIKNVQSCYQPARNLESLYIGLRYISW